VIADLSLQHFRFHLEPKVPLQLPACNKGNVIRGGFGRRIGGVNRRKATGGNKAGEFPR
jgi:hypothetical protein